MNDRDIKIAQRAGESLRKIGYDLNDMASDLARDADDRGLKTIGQILLGIASVLGTLRENLRLYGR